MISEEENGETGFAVVAQRHGDYAGSRSFVAQGDDGVNAQGAEGWDVAGQEGDGCEEDGYGCERYRVIGAYGKKQAGEEACQRGGDGEADGYAEKCDARALAENEAQDVLTLRAERHANADFLSAQCDAVSHDAINSNGGEDQRECAEDSEEHEGEAACGDGIVHELLHGIDGEDGLVFINCSDGYANGGSEARRINGGAYYEVHIAVRLLAVWIVNLQARGIVEAVEFGVRDDAYDGDPFFIVAGMSAQNAFADGIAVGPEAAGHGGVDEGD